MKQETLEEATKKYLEKEYSTPKPLTLCLDFARFGAKWQQKKMYSEEEVLKLVSEVVNPNALLELTLEEWFEQFKKK